MKKKALAVLLTASVIAGTMGGTATIVHADEEGKVINIYSWNDEFRQRLEAVYPEVKETSKDGTVTTLNDGTEIHWIVNPNQDGVYQQKLDEALMKQADVDTDDKVDIFLSETDYVYKYTDAEADTAVPLKDLGIDILIGNNCKKDVARILSEYYEDTSLCEAVIDINHTNEYEEMTLVKPNERCRAYVKVQDGCNNFCTYCIIPYTRGRIRSRKLADVVQEVEGLACEGVQEVVITGINLSSYEDENGASLLMLLQAVAKVDGIRRIRMGSLEPRVITEEFLDGITALDKVCPHFHLSLQSACNETLKRMNRKYTIEEYMEKCDMIRKAYDRPAIATDVIVGFPGETEEEFATTVANLEKLNLYEMHVFKYSKRSGTIAATMEHQVSDAVKEKRSNILLELTANQKAAYEQQFSGELLPVLMEEYDCIDKDGKPVYVMKGHTDRYILVKQETTREVCEQSINSFVDVLYRPEKSK